MIYFLKDISEKLNDAHENILNFSFLLGKIVLRLLRELSAVLFFVSTFILYLSILISIFPIKDIIWELIIGYKSITFHGFVSSLVTLIEFVLFDIILLLLANGIYLCILQPLAGEKEFNVQKMFKDFVIYLSSPFLMVVGSILIVSVFEIIIESVKYSS